MIVGTEWLVDAEGCRPEQLRDLSAVRAACESVLRDLDLKTVREPLAHPFPPPGGVTVLYLLAESHLTCHTYPEHGIATFSLCCCSPRPRWDWEGHLQRLFGASSVSVRCLPRGGAPAAADLPATV